ncbi:MAG: beta-ketoacyl-ACP synthase II [Candidatus Margulisbacteria bacterium]|nr:beta-ketoacyl-ACP synthase II [Candidatus Margulisiibacteriota bacterium]
MNRRVVVTGLGPVSPNGSDRETFWTSLIHGHSVIKILPQFSSSEEDYRTHLGAEISGFTAEPYITAKEIKRFSRFTQLAIVGARKALADGHLKVEQENQHRVGVILGTGIGGLEVAAQQAIDLKEKGLGKLNPFAANASVPSAAASEISVLMGLKGPNLTVSTGCSSGLNAIGLAYDMIKMNRADVLITGGAETPLTPVIFATFDISRQMSVRNEIGAQASSPFDVNRDGFVLSEGAGIVILEELEHALKRNAFIYAEVIGYGVMADAYKSFGLDPEGKGAAEAIKLALRDAEITPQDVNYICAHASSSREGDLKETNAIKAIFKDYAYKLPVSSIKSVIGMPFGASGGFQLIASVLAIENSIIPPTINLKTKDPLCDLDYVPNTARETNLEYVLMNSFGLGGNNSVLVVKKYS